MTIKTIDTENVVPEIDDIFTLGSKDYAWHDGPQVTTHYVQRVARAILEAAPSVETYGQVEFKEDPITMPQVTVSVQEQAAPAVSGEPIGHLWENEYYGSGTIETFKNIDTSSAVALYTTPQPRIPAEAIAEIKASSRVFSNGDFIDRGVWVRMDNVLEILARYNK